METNCKPNLQGLEIDRAKLERVVCQTSSIKEGEERQYVSLLLLWCCLVEDTFLSYGVSPMDKSNLVRWLLKTAATNIREVSAYYGSALDMCRRSDTFDHMAKTFKGSKERGCSGDLFSPLAHYFKYAPDTHREGTVWFRVVTQILSFPFRANLDSPSLDEAWASYVQVDSECIDTPCDLEKELAQAYSFLIKDDNITDLKFTPRHGPGVIAEWDRDYHGPKDLRSKYLLMKIPQIVAYAVRAVGVVAHNYEIPLTSYRRPCSFMPVPKSIGKTRTICIEPAGMQFSQQGLRFLLEDVIRQSPASRHIDFKSQTKSVELARIGSIDGSFSTIDLSNASDRISYSLMRGVLKQSKLYPLLVACRSHTVQYKRQSLNMKKLHTSGSAACFPTETLLFTLMCQVALWRTVRSNRVGHNKYDYSVFGDDIVISTPCVPALLEILALCGAKVNESKTFIGSSFTECCGHEFFKGVDVTPFRIPRGFSMWEWREGVYLGDDVESFDQCIDFANKCKEFSLIVLRKLFIRLAFDRSITWDNPAFGDTGIHSDFVRNDHLIVDTSLTRDYQRHVVRCKRVSSRISWESYCIEDQQANFSPQHGGTEIDLLHWFVCSDLRPDDFISYGRQILERRRKTFIYAPFPKDIG